MAKLYAIMRAAFDTGERYCSLASNFASSHHGDRAKLFAVRCGFLDCRSHSSGAILQIFPFCTDTPRSKNGAPTASRLPSKDCVGGNVPPQFHRDEIADCLSSPFTNLMKEHPQPSAALDSEELTTRSDGTQVAMLMMTRLQKRRGRDKERAVRRNRKAARSDGEIKRTGVRWLPAVAKACLHIGFCKFATASKRHVARWHVPPRRISSFDFNLLSDGARNVRRGGAPLFVRHRAR